MGFLRRGQGTASGDFTIANVEAPVRESMLWICEKCGLKLADKKDENPSRSLQKLVKKNLAEQSRKGEVRSMVTSCMNICPKGKIAACIVHFGKGNPSTRFYEFELDKNSEALAAALLAKLDQTKS